GPVWPAPVAPRPPLPEEAPAPEPQEVETVSLEEADAEAQDATAKKPGPTEPTEVEEEEVEMDESLADRATFMEEQEDEDAEVTDIIGGDVENKEEAVSGGRDQMAERRFRRRGPLSAFGSIDLGQCRH